MGFSVTFLYRKTYAKQLIRLASKLSYLEKILNQYLKIILFIN